VEKGERAPGGGWMRGVAFLEVWKTFLGKNEERKNLSRTKIAAPAKGKTDKF